MSHDPTAEERRAVAAHLLTKLRANERPTIDADLAASVANFTGTGPTAEYVGRIAVAMLQAPAGSEGKAAIVGALARLLDAVHQIIVPAELSMLAAVIADRAGSGDAQAEGLAGAVVVRHVLDPQLRAAAPASNAALVQVVTMALNDLADGIPFGERPGSRLAALRPDFAGLAELFDAWMHELITAGRFALAIHAERPDADPDDAVTQAEAIIASDMALADAFVQPTPDDPLGTSPRYGLTAIGQAIEVARLQRSTDYDWVAVQHFADTSPAEFAALLRDERLHVLDHVRL
jgi:hypothetical protein